MRRMHCLKAAVLGLGSVVHPYQDPFLTDGQIYAFGAFDSSYFFGSQQFDDPIKILG